MSGWHGYDDESPDETEELCDENYEDPDELKEELQEWDEQIPDVYWKDEIRKIKHPVLREKAIETAKKIVEEEELLKEKVENGDLTPYQAELAANELSKKQVKAATGAGLASVELTHDHFVDVAEEADLLQTGNYERVKQVDEIEKLIDRVGPEIAQEHVEEMFRNGKISEKAYEFISRKIRLASLK